MRLLILLFRAFVALLASLTPRKLMQKKLELDAITATAIVGVLFTTLVLASDLTVAGALVLAALIMLSAAASVLSMKVHVVQHRFAFANPNMDHFDAITATRKGTITAHRHRRLR